MRDVRDTCNKIALEFSESTYKLLNTTGQMANPDE